MIKKMVAWIMFAMLASTATVMASNVGDVIGKVHYSGLDTYINNYPVPAYHMDGRQVICAEDLREYGFNVVWNGETRTLDIIPDYSTKFITGKYNVKRQYYLQNKKAYDILYSDIKVYLNGNEIQAYFIDGKTMIRIRDLENLGRCEYSVEANYSKAWIDGLPQTEYKPLDVDYTTKLTVVLDPGHGKSSVLMTEQEKADEGYIKHNGVWGEWRHWKNGTSNIECEGDGCHNDAACFYPMNAGDRDFEPEINLRNAYVAKKYLEEMGYNVRLTRTTNEENPCFSKRVSYCYPDNDICAEPDAACYVCIHSNAGGGKGSAYIAAGGGYTQRWINSAYSVNSNTLGSCINEKIVSQTSLGNYGTGAINGLGHMILFNKCPVPAGYLEIGFFDSAEKAILDSEYEIIGRAIADGINEYMYK